ncbi:MAG: hypothetical protein ACRDMH_03250 [Solirubrobacterales bacterium]
MKPLAVLADLSNEDKHQATLPGVAAIPPHLLTEEELDFRPIAMNDVALIERFEVYANRPIEDGSEIVSAQLTITGPDPQVGVDGRLPFDVAFGRGMVPMRGLVEIRRAVRSVIEPMQRIFPSGS